MSDRKALKPGQGPVRLRSKRRHRICRVLQYAYGNRCWYCTRPFEGDDVRLRTLDHLVPLSRGGTHEIDNLRLCCTKCNNAKGDMAWWEYVLTDDYRQRRDWQIYLREHPPRPKIKVEVISSLAVA